MGNASSSVNEQGNDLKVASQNVDKESYNYENNEYRGSDEQCEIVQNQSDLEVATMDELQVKNIEENYTEETNNGVEDEQNKLQEDREMQWNEIKIKREQRESVLRAKKKEIQEVRAELERQREQNLQLRLILEKSDDNNAKVLLEENLKLKEELQQTKVELETFKELEESFENERVEYKKHVEALKDVINVSKMVMNVRETELNRLKEKLAELQQNALDEEARMMSIELRHEYEKQLKNMKNLRLLYEERARISHIERKNLNDILAETREKLQLQTKRNEELDERIKELELDVSNKYDQIASLESNLGLTEAEMRGLQNEMNVINTLFSQVLSGSTTEIDLDQLSKVLEENRELLVDMNEKDESSAMPKVLLNLVNEMKTMEDNESGSKEETSERSLINKDIVNNLPKVWRVLTELLNQQMVEPVEINDEVQVGTEHPCYKSVDTPMGPKNVLSVSKTYIRLKDLILEKKHLEREMLRMKHLNTHLETRLQDQEKRLESVTSELSKTWHLVDKMEKQHQQLHTQEQILRYELSHKRKLLNQLKEELEQCRVNWVKAREKNSESEEECQKLRHEFASRRIQKKREEEDDSSTDTESESIQPKTSKISLLHEVHVRNTLRNQSEEIGDETETDPEGTDGAEESSPGTSCLNLEKIGEKCDELIKESKQLLDDSKLKILENQFEQLLNGTTNGRENDDEEPKPEDQQEENEFESQEFEKAVKQEDEAPEIEDNEQQSTSTRTPEQILAERDARFQKLQEECTILKQKYTNQTQLGTNLCDKLDQLHEKYGENSENHVENLEGTSPNEIISEAKEIKECEMHADNAVESKNDEIQVKNCQEERLDTGETTAPEIEEETSTAEEETSAIALVSESLGESSETSIEDDEQVKKLRAIEARFRAIQEQYKEQCEEGSRIVEKINQLQEKLAEKRNE